MRELRLARGWTQEGLAHRAGKHWTYIGGIERGTRNPTISVVEDIARALEVPVSELFMAVGTPEDDAAFPGEGPQRTSR